jgi:hypothetical protein
MAFDFSPWATPRRTFEPDANDLDAKACGTTPTKVGSFKRRHGLAGGDRLSEAARALLLQELEADQRARKGEQLARTQALALIAERTTPEAAEALAAVLPNPLSFNRLGDAFWIDSRHLEAYITNRVEALTGKRYATSGAACLKAAALAPAAAPAAEAIKADPMADRYGIRCRRDLFWGAILRLDQLEGPPPADPEAFYSWCQLKAYRRHSTGPNLSDLLTGRMQETEARALLQLPTSGPLDPGAIRVAYRAQARHHHPDAGGDRHRFEQLAAARDRLMLVGVE